MLAALDGLEEERGAGTLDLRVGGDGRLDVGHEVGVDGDDIALGAEAAE
jgi:hypothetical protein